MPKPYLTDDQRQLWLVLQQRMLDQAGAGKPLDSSSFAYRMLHPEYVEATRQLLSPELRDRSDSAAFYDMYRSEVGNTGLRPQDVPEPEVRRSKEGTWDTIVTPAIGDIPARTRVEFTPSLKQRVVDKVNAVKDYDYAGAASSYGRQLLQALKPTQDTDTLDAYTTNGIPRRLP